MCPSLVDKWRVSGILSRGHMARVQHMQPTSVYILGIRWRGETQEDKYQEKTFRVFSQAPWLPITMWGNEQEQPLNEEQPHIPTWNLFLQKCISFISAFVWCQLFVVSLFFSPTPEYIFKAHSSIYSSSKYEENTQPWPWKSSPMLIRLSAVCALSSFCQWVWSLVVLILVTHIALNRSWRDTQILTEVEQFVTKCLFRVMLGFQSYLMKL